MSQPAENPAPAPAPESAPPPPDPAPPAPPNPPSDLDELETLSTDCDQWLNLHRPNGFIRRALARMPLARDMPDKWARDGIDPPLYLELETLWDRARQIGTRCGALPELPTLPKADCLLNEAYNFAVALQNYANRLLEYRRAREAEPNASFPSPAVASTKAESSRTPQQRHGLHSNDRAVRSNPQKPRRKVGRPKRTESDPEVYQENQLYRDWKASKLPLPEFLEARGLNVPNYTLVIDRARKRFQKQRKQ